MLLQQSHIAYVYHLLNCLILKSSLSVFAASFLALILKMLCLIILIKTIDIYFQIFAAEADLIEPDEIFSNLQIYCFKNYNTFLILLTVHII